MKAGSGFMSADRALELISEVVEEFGHDYVYPRASGDEPCVYQEFGNPSCIVGHVLYRHGVDVGLLAELDEWGAAAGKLHPEKVGVSREALLILGAVQTRQDAGKTWGECLEYVRGLADRVKSEGGVQ